MNRSISARLDSSGLVSSGFDSARSISAPRTATLVGDFDRSPAYAGLADALTLLIGDGRIPLGTRLPSERELTDALGVSRTTVTRAYAALRDAGYAEALQGSGTFTRVPGGRARAHDRALLPLPGDGDAIDLNCAATSAPPGLAAATPRRRPTCRRTSARSRVLPGRPAPAAGGHRRDLRRCGGSRRTPDQIMVTPGALSAASIVAQAFTGPGDRVLVESPVYPNATLAIRHSGARLAGSPVDPEGWDLEATGAALRQAAPALAYLIPDFQNPTGHLMTDDQRAEYAGHLRRTHTVAVVDEAHQALALEGQEMPRPFACFAPDTITIGSASKSFWGGLRLGWIRAPRGQMDRLTRARVGLDLGAPVLEQLALARLLGRPSHDPRRPARPAARAAGRARLRPERAPARVAVPGADRRAGAVVRAAGAARRRRSSAEAERLGVIVAPGPVFAAEGGLDQFVRVPWTRERRGARGGRAPPRGRLGRRTRSAAVARSRSTGPGRWSRSGRRTVLRSGRPRAPRPH